MAKEARPRYNERFLKERYEKDDTYFTVYDHYTPNYYKPTIAGKFYSRYEKLDLSQADAEIVDAIKTAKVRLPRDKYPWPVTEAHRYGWYEPLVLMDRKDRRFYAGATIAPFIQHEIVFRQDRTMVKPKFTGIPFKL